MGDSVHRDHSLKRITSYSCPKKREREKRKRSRMHQLFIPQNTAKKKKKWIAQ